MATTRENSQAAREAKLDELHERLTGAVEQLVSGEDWARALAFAARFRARSFSNTLLIWVQHEAAYEAGRVPEPMPSYVAGYRQWQTLGRQVEKGQAGYQILAPVTGRFATIARRRELLSQLVTAIRDFIVTAVVIGVIATSAMAAGVLSDTDQTRLSPAVLPALVVLALAGVSAAADATTVFTQLHPLVTSARRVGEGIHRAPLVTAPTAPRPLPAGPLGLRFCDVSFTYPSRPPTLTGWSAEIAAGEHVGLAGPSGSGKSTIVALASRLWDPSSGSIEVVGTDGTSIPLTEIDDASLRTAIAVVDQEANLFHGTVRDNLVRGNRQPPDPELTAVLERVGAIEWIGLDDHLGQSGLRLSGGQQARLCLARALARKPRILLVDEVTASLDPGTEQAISDVIAEYDGTVLIASHRAETLARLDRIITTNPADGRGRLEPEP